ADEGREIGIGDIELIAVCLEIASNERTTLSLDGIEIFEPPNPWDLFRKNAMKPWIDAMCLDGNRNEFACRDLDRPCSHLDQGIARHLRELLRVALDQRGDQRLLVREVLVQLTDTDPSHLGNPVRARAVISLFDQNASSRFD